MKKFIFALVAVVCSVCGANEICGDKTLNDCINHFDKQCKAKNYSACGVVANLFGEQERFGETKKYSEMVCDKANSKDSYQIERIDGSLGPKMPIIIEMQFACSLVANLYYEGLGVRQDYDKSFQYFKKACNLGYAKSCAAVGRAYLYGKGAKKDYKLAKSYLEKSCKMQSDFGCIGLGIMYQEGEGVKQNLSKAKELFGKACDLGEQKGCNAYKMLNEQGVK